MAIKDELIIESAVKAQGVFGGGVVGLYVFGIPLSDWASIFAIVTMTITTVIAYLAFRRGKK